MSFGFDPHGFDPAFSAEADPAFPPDGVWREPLYCYDRDGSAGPEPVTRWGAPFVIRVVPERAEPWVGMFAAGGLGGHASTGAHACPRRDQLCVLVDGLAYLVSVDAPGVGASPLAPSITQIVATGNPPLLLLVTFSSVIALGPTGVAWQTGRIALDGLRVDRVDGNRLLLIAESVEGGFDQMVLDSTTGEQVAGRRFQDHWPPDALA
jgi:hypothetical protein